MVIHDIVLDIRNTIWISIIISLISIIELWICNFRELLLSIIELSISITEIWISIIREFIRFGFHIQDQSRKYAEGENAPANHLPVPIHTQWRWVPTFYNIVVNCFNEQNNKVSSEKNGVTGAPYIYIYIYIYIIVIFTGCIETSNMSQLSIFMTHCFTHVSHF